MKTTKVLDSSPYIKEFYKNLHGINRSPWQVYCDFLQLNIDAFISDHTPEHPREKDYMQIIESYRKEEAEKFSNMLGCVMQYMKETNKECLSEIWEGVAANSNLGQFFTPWTVCMMMAKMELENSVLNWDKFTPENKCTISDPSCGGGRTLVAALKLVPAGKLNSALFHGIDIDLNVCHAAALNMLFFNANSYIIHGNALSLEVWHVFKTIHTPFGGEIVEITDKEVMERTIRYGLKTKNYAEETNEEERIISIEPKTLKTEQQEQLELF